MLDLVTGISSECSDVSRREFIRVGGLSALGLTLPGFFRLQHLTAASGAPAKKAMRCILLWMQGGPSHHDTFDPKPDAPVEIRGEFNAIDTKVSGVRFGEHLPKLAARADKMAVVRTFAHKDNNHTAATHHIITGTPQPGVKFDKP